MKPTPIQGIDPRCFGPKIDGNGVLPFVSRKRLMKVRHYLPIPTECHICDGSVLLVENSVVYSGRSFGEWPYCYLCQGCGAYVGLHPFTDLPLGFLADASTRSARKAAKAPFGTLTRAHFTDRNAAYAWLSQATGIQPLLCHFSMFDEDECIRVFNVCFDKLFDI